MRVTADDRVERLTHRLRELDNLSLTSGRLRALAERADVGEDHDRLCSTGAERAADRVDDRRGRIEPQPGDVGRPRAARRALEGDADQADVDRAPPDDGVVRNPIDVAAI